MERLNNILGVDHKNRLSLPTVLILTVFMAFNVQFFHIAGYTGLESIAGWVMFFFIILTFFLVLYTGNIAKYRLIFFGTGALLFFPAFIAGMYETIGHMYLTDEALFNNQASFCPIVIPFVIIPYALTKTVIFSARLTGVGATIYAVLILWFIATVTIGRGWCSWVCFFGAWDDGISRILKKPVIKIDSANNKIRYANFAVLTFVVLATAMTLSVVYCVWFCPFKIITEYIQVSGLPSFFAFIFMVLAFFGLVIVLPLLTKKRFQCTAFCPFGAFQSLADKLSLYKIRINTHKCKKCMKCVSRCPTLSLSERIIKDETGRPHITCTKCGECIQACPHGAIAYGFSLCKKPKSFSLERVLQKLSGRRGVFSQLLRKVLTTLSEILSPKALFLFSAYSVSMIIMSVFARGTIVRLLHLIVNGSFTLN